MDIFSAFLLKVAEDKDLSWPWRVQFRGFVTINSWRNIIAEKDNFLEVENPKPRKVHCKHLLHVPEASLLFKDEFKLPHVDTTIPPSTSAMQVLEVFTCRLYFICFSYQSHWQSSGWDISRAGNGGYRLLSFSIQTVVVTGYSHGDECVGW